MATLPENHDRLYFDTLIRTQKQASLLALINATYHAKNSNTVRNDSTQCKAEIARRLQYAYGLYRDNVRGYDDGVGSYSGSLGQFESQYTFGHEMAIWTNSNLDLNPVALSVAENKITIEKYFDIVLLNYFQPINECGVHLLYQILKYLNANSLDLLSKDDMKRALEANSEDSSINALLNILISSSYFEKGDNDTLRYVSSVPVNVLMDKCNVTYIGRDGYELAKNTLDTDQYNKYIINEQNSAIEFEDGVRITGGYNHIYYGVPGCGKSYFISEKYELDDYNSERIVFHPDYTYSDFVGQILPSTDEQGKISYPFKPGPFTRILKKAELNPSIKYYLIIEEINRGNAPAIFGDIFQLLDRDGKGNSNYSIKNSDISVEIYGAPDHAIRIPSNLVVLATMNTADQNVFTLDTAFKRRWELKAIFNDFNDLKFASHVNLHLLGDDNNPTWKNFAETINAVIENNDDIISTADKRLGVYFLSDNEILNKVMFSEKVLMYLWNDVFVFDRTKVFKPEYKTLEKLLKGFEQNTFSVFNDALGFNDSVEAVNE